MPFHRTITRCFYILFLTKVRIVLKRIVVKQFKAPQNRQAIPDVPLTWKSGRVGFVEREEWRRAQTCVHRYEVLSETCATKTPLTPTHAGRRHAWRRRARIIKFILGEVHIVCGRLSYLFSFIKILFHLDQHERNCSSPGWTMRQPNWRQGTFLFLYMWINIYYFYFFVRTEL